MAGSSLHWEGVAQEWVILKLWSLRFSSKLLLIRRVGLQDPTSFGRPTPTTTTTTREGLYTAENRKQLWWFVNPPGLLLSWNQSLKMTGSVPLDLFNLPEFCKYLSHSEFDAPTLVVPSFGSHLFLLFHKLREIRWGGVLLPPWS